MASVRLRTFSLVKTLRRRVLETADESAGTNTRSAPRRHAPRRPCCLLCSARARSGWRARQLPGAFRWELGLVAPLLPAAPLFPSFGIAPSPVANIPTEAAGNEERGFH